MSEPAGRRRLLSRVLGAGALGLLGPRFARAMPAPELVRDPAGVVDLVEGFRYEIVERVGDPMDDGYRVPGRADAMACFPLPSGQVALMRNHELTAGTSMGAWAPDQAPPAETFSPEGMGGVSRVVVDAATGQRISSNLVLAGTTLNCAGGISPWGWLSCEETTATGHGYVFLCDPKAPRLMPPRRITAYGRFRHEAAVVDPPTHIAYLTEDQLDSAFYRFVPDDPTKPFEGRLQALCIRDEPRADTARARTGARFRVSWVDVPEPTPSDDSVRHQARDRGAARFVRGEGLWRAGSSLFFTATVGGPIGRGQVFRLDTTTSELTVLLASEDPRDLDMPDNLTVGPTGVIYLAEDGPGGNLLRILTPDGVLQPFARNAASQSEFAGVCFSPNGQQLFVNLQHDGLTLAIRGPFQRLLAARGVEPRPPEPWLPPGVAGATAGAGLIALATLMRRRRRHRPPTS